MRSALQLESSPCPPQRKSPRSHGDSVQPRQINKGILKKKMAQKILLKKKERNTKDFWLGGARRESQNRFSLAEGLDLTDTLISDFWPPVSLCHVKPPSAVVICYGSPRELPQDG